MPVDLVPVMGWETKFGVGAAAPTTKAIELTQFGLIGSIQSVRNNGARGTRSNFATGVREGVKVAEGSISCEPRPDELAILLPFILGAAASGTTYALAEALPSHVWDYYAGPDSFRFTDCAVNRATFRSGPGQPLQLTLDVIALDWDDTITFPTLTNYSSLSPFMHHDSVVTLGGTAYKPDSITVVIDNRLNPIQRNSQTRTHLKPADRIITTSLQFGFSTDEQVLHTLAATANTTGSIVYTNGAVSLGFAMPAMQTPRQTPPMQNRSAEVSRQFQWLAKANAAALDELVVTLDSTP